MSIDAGKYLMDDEPLRFNERWLDEVLLQAARKGASDITIQTGKPIFIEVYGKYYPMTRREIDSIEIANLINVLYGEGGSAIVKQGQALDPSYEIRVSRNERYRFRVNATACYAGLEDGAQITIRVISSEPPKLESMGIEEEILLNCRPENGIVLVSGKTGTGKSTLMASMMRAIIEDPETSKKIVSYESPIEYVYDTIEGRSLICQTELPRHLRGGFEEAIPNVSRRATNIVLIGESRNIETLRAAISASDSGQAVYTTFHAGSVTETMYRMINMFPNEEKESKMFELSESMRLLINQKLVPSVDGRRCALREYLVFNDEVRETLRMTVNVRDITIKISELIETYGQSYRMAARRALESGKIDSKVASKFGFEA